MFNDGRSKKVVFIAHCFLNQNSISDGTAIYPSAFRSLIDYFLSANIGIVQMPCPELFCLGLDRGDIHGADRSVVVENTRIRSEMKSKIHNVELIKLADYVVHQILEYKKHDFEIIGIIGANRSPTCGVDTTSNDNAEVNGMGLFINEISDQLSRENISIPMIGLKGNENIQEKLDQLLCQKTIVNNPKITI